MMDDDTCQWCEMAYQALDDAERHPDAYTRDAITEIVRCIDAHDTEHTRYDDC